MTKEQMQAKHAYAIKETALKRKNIRQWAMPTASSAANGNSDLASGRRAALHALRSICFKCTAVLHFLRGREISKNWADPDLQGRRRRRVPLVVHSAGRRKKV